MIDWKAYNHPVPGATHKVVDTKHIELGTLGQPLTQWFMNHAAAFRYAEIMRTAGHGLRFKVFPVMEGE